MATAVASAAARAVVHRHTAVVSLPSLGQRLRLITPACAVYHMTPDELPQELGPAGEPFWGFVWPGSWGLSLHVRRHPHLVRGKRVLDFASGCGVSAIAAAQHGAAAVVATEIDELACAAVDVNAELNGVQGCVQSKLQDVIGDTLAPSFNVVLAGDICYDEGVARRVSEWLTAQARDGVTVLVGDPGRSFLPKAALRHVASYDMPREPAPAAGDVSTTSGDSRAAGTGAGDYNGGDGGAPPEVQVLESKGFADTGVWAFTGVE